VAKEDAFGDELAKSYKNIQRFNFGFEYRTSTTDTLALGLMYNPDPEKDTNLNFMGATFGYHSIEKIADSSYGIFYNQASDTNDGSKTSFQMVGLFISSSINFMN